MLTVCQALCQARDTAVHIVIVLLCIVVSVSGSWHRTSKTLGIL